MVREHRTRSTINPALLPPAPPHLFDGERPLKRGSPEFGTLSVLEVLVEVCVGLHPMLGGIVDDPIGNVAFTRVGPLDDR